jgi:glyoxylase I family protein
MAALLKVAPESRTVDARLAERTARKEQWRRDRAAGKDARPPKPAQNDRPKVGRGQ